MNSFLRSSWNAGVLVFQMNGSHVWAERDLDEQFGCSLCRRHVQLKEFTSFASRFIRLVFCNRDVHFTEKDESGSLEDFHFYLQHHWK